MSTVLQQVKYMTEIMDHGGMRDVALQLTPDESIEFNLEQTRNYRLVTQHHFQCHYFARYKIQYVPFKVGTFL